MKYKTVIEIVSDADNPAEAADLAGDYLQGQIDTGVTMKCYTQPVRKYARPLLILSSFIVMSTMAFGIYFCGKKDVTCKSAVYQNNISAIQPPLKTMSSDSDFKGDWKSKKNAAEINYIKK